jgi:nitrate/nitrite transporter NarK
VTPVPRTSAHGRTARVVTLLALLVAGEAVFGLPFHVARFFRPTLLAALDLSNTELGTYFSVYGVLAMLSYLPGGILADHFSARRLLVVALTCTGLGGLYLASLPSGPGLPLLFAFFGVTTILPFWAALIRATREWGGPNEQGMAFGLLDGGRGVVAAGLASIALVPLTLTLGDDPARATDAGRLVALGRVVYVYTAATLLAAVLVWFAVPETPVREPLRQRVSLSGVREAFLDRKVWLQAVIVICAYCAYKGIDNYSLFAVEAYGMDEVAGARVSVLGSWLRPLAALGAGLLADRIAPSRTTLLCFALLLLGYASFVLVEPASGTVVLLWANVAITCACAFGLRGVYFALLEESRIPPRATGTAVGVISLVGFTPDVFIAPLIGSLLDAHPGVTGHRHAFLLLGGFAVSGAIATAWLRRTSADGGRGAVG